MRSWLFFIFWRHCVVLCIRQELAVQDYSADRGLILSNDSLHGQQAEYRRLLPNKCGFDGEDTFVLDTDHVEVTPSSATMQDVRDSRNGIKELGLLKSIAQNALKLARVVGNYRIFLLQLTGRQAVEVVKAQYGIIQEKVPRNCFDMMRRDLSIDFEHTTWEEVKQRRKRIRWYLTVGLEKGCADAKAPASDEEVTIGKRAKLRLEAMYWGYWALYETQTSAKHSVISVRVLDEKRFKQGDHRLRQIWHFGRMHMYKYLDGQLRQNMISNPNLGKDEIEDLKYQRYMLMYLLDLHNARIEYVDLDARGSCVSSQANDPEHIIQTIGKHRSSLFRSTLVWRERQWQMFMHAAHSFVLNPFTFIKKQWDRKNDKFKRSYFGAKLGMVLKPIMKGVAMAGLVLGIMTGGAVTFPTLLAGFFTGAGVAALVGGAAAEAGPGAILWFILEKIFRAPLTAFSNQMQFYLMAKLEASPQMNKFWGMMDDDDVMPEIIANANLKLQMEVESILESDPVREHLQSVDEDMREEMEAETRRYAEGMIRKSFIEELAPQVVSAIQQLEAMSDPNHGWLSYRRWKIYRKGDYRTQIAGKKIRFEGPGGHWQAIVVEYTKGWFQSTAQLTIRKQRQDVSSDFLGVKHNIKLTSETKRFLEVHDTEAYSLFSAGWLSWNDWEQYHRGYVGAAALQGKEVYIDEDSLGCRLPDYDLCAQGLANTFEKEDEDGDGDHLKHGSPVVKVGWASLDLSGGRRIYLNVDGRPSHPCRTQGLAVTKAMRPCLRIKDPPAYQRFLANGERRDQHLAWTNGSLAATVTISEEVINAMRTNGKTCGECQDEAARSLLEKKYGVESVSLDNSIGVREDGLLTDEERLTDEALSKGLAELDPSVLDGANAAVDTSTDDNLFRSDGYRSLVPAVFCGIYFPCLAVLFHLMAS